MFGSVTSCFEVAFPPLPPLWHESREIVTATRINLAARSIRFRICNNSRTSLRCKPCLRKILDDISFNVRLKMADDY